MLHVVQSIDFNTGENSAVRVTSVECEDRLYESRNWMSKGGVCWESWLQ